MFFGFRVIADAYEKEISVVVCQRFHITSVSDLRNGTVRRLVPLKLNDEGGLFRMGFPWNVAL